MLDWDMPYAANRSPVLAQNIVASSQPLAVEAGLNALRKGGNAVDAALATAITLTVVEPCNNGIGSDAFALIHDGKQLHGLNASGRSPAALTPDRFSHHKSMPVWGWEAVTVPGAVSAWVKLSNKFGALPFEALFEDAIHYARDGYQVGPKTAFFWKHAMRAFKDYEAFQTTFGIDGLAPQTGQLMRLPDHANTLEEIAATKGESFYRGKLAEAIARDAAENNAAMTLDDLAQHSADWVDPISMSGLSAELHEIPPNGQGLMALISLGIVEQLHDDMVFGSADSVHLQIEAQRIAYAEMERHLSDIQAMKIPVEEFLDSAYINRRAAEVDMKKANENPVTLGAHGDTVYLTAADANGMMISMIQSNYRGFGSGVVVPGTGISLQNRGSGFVLEEGHPNQVGPSKRPYHTIIPGFATRDNDPLMSFGVMGGHMQAQGHLQMMLRVARFKQNPQAASDAPRWYVFEDGRVALEPGFDKAVCSALEARGHRLELEEPEHLFGGAQLIVKMEDGYCGGSDHRKEGYAAGM